MAYLFVYGTLLKHFKSEVMQPLQSFMSLEGDGWLNGTLYDLGNYPAFVSLSDEAETVTGEVYKIRQNAEEILAALDEYEGTEYSRQQQWVWLQNGNKLKCWVYVYQYTPGPKHIKIKNGDYVAYIRNKVSNG